MLSRHISPKDLATMIGVGESTIKRWIDDGRMNVVRTMGGHRRIPITEAVRFIRAGHHPVLEPSALGVAANSERALNHSLDDAVHDALVANDGVRARDLVVTAYLSGRTITELCDGPLRLAMTRIGVLWQHGDQGITVEHLATEIVLSLLQRLIALLPEAPPRAPLALGGTGGGDPYMISTLMASATLAEGGWRTLNLGANTPAAVVLAAVAKHKPALVWRAHCAPATPGLAAEIVQLADAVAPRALALGGCALDRLGLPQRDNLFVMRSMGELAAFAKGAKAGAGR